MQYVDLARLSFVHVEAGAFVLGSVCFLYRTYSAESWLFTFQG
jgi:hypothetical protein